MLSQASTACFQIGDRNVGTGNPCLLVAEVAQAHDGQLTLAHEYIDRIAETGADAVKFQTHIADAESTPQEPWRVSFAKDASRYDYWKRMEFSQAEWTGLSEHAVDAGLIFLSSPFSLEAVDLLECVGVPAWKTGAGEIATLPLLEHMARTGKPVMLSTGMSTGTELDRAVACVRAAGAPVGVYQCTSAYPCPPEKIGLNLIHTFRERYACPVGLSDHSGVIHAGLAAAALGANMIEIHVTLDRGTGLPDEPVSLLPSELKELVRGVRFIELALAHPVDKEHMADELSGLREIFSKSVVAAHALPAGRQLQAGDLALKKPGTGWPAAQIKELIGRTLAWALAKDHLISEDDLE